MAKRKTLPKDFDEMLSTKSIADLRAVFDKTLLDARGGYGKQTAIGFVDCPDDLIVWLVGQGLDVDAADTYGRTPLSERACRGRASQLELLLSLGADIQRPDRYGNSPLHTAVGSQREETTRVLLVHGADPLSTNERGRTPLVYGLARTQNIDIPAMAAIARMLLDAGDTATDDARAQVTRIGEGFEFHRAGFNADLLDETEAGLTTLYELFDVEPVPRRNMHDGVSPIIVAPGAWQTQHQQLWELLVPSSGPAATVQGEAIRITGRVSREILDNGSPNWGPDFRLMLDALTAYVVLGTPLPEGELAEVRSLARALRGGNDDGDRSYRLTELVVGWVGKNPIPIPLGDVTSAR